MKKSLLLALSLLVMTACAPAMADTNPYDVCERAVDSWDARTKVYEVTAIESATAYGDVYTCVLQANVHKPEFTMPINLIMKVNDKTQSYTVKKWGLM